MFYQADVTNVVKTNLIYSCNYVRQVRFFAEEGCRFYTAWLGVIFYGYWDLIEFLIFRMM